ncbi:MULTISPECIES: hypothetical protein [unclassified Streptomyces]|uniref:hypothetical protein n=1 Tax=unclassified Streptomyces TaxID=2593676 RepID=UPI0023667BE6|nr:MULTISPECIES: hypothetical protein [unclassified Streptomyces]MDF3141916.1 hypothetical protein [Streptomyces sp. T21Q-yed]WDF36937.1 hypothetical protein PBV52_09190 [Streptomyces sp. T12]
MPSPALDAALADIDTVFNGFASPTEIGCERCFDPQETAYLRTPYTRVPADLVRRFVFKVPDHFEDHAAVMRRLLPQTARAMADGSMDVAWWGHGLTRVDWHSWPTEQSDAIQAFLTAWWRDALASPEPPHPVTDVFDSCSSIAGTVTPFLADWIRHPVADTHLVSCARRWMADLLADDLPLTCGFDEGKEGAVAELQSWFARNAPARLRAQGEPGLATEAELLALPYDDRWAHPYWYKPSATN